MRKGFIQSEIQNSAYEYQRAIEEGRQIVVGVNKFQIDEQRSVEPFKMDPQSEAQQIERLRAVRASRSAERAAQSLERLQAAARSGDNLMPHILDACRALATVGEISNCLRSVFGEYRDTF